MKSKKFLGIFYARGRVGLVDKRPRGAGFARSTPRHYFGHYYVIIMSLFNFFRLNNDRKWSKSRKIG
jgi:hypothetical protein